MACKYGPVQTRNMIHLNSDVVVAVVERDMARGREKRRTGSGPVHGHVLVYIIYGAVMRKIAVDSSK